MSASDNRMSAATVSKSSMNSEHEALVSDGSQRDTVQLFRIGWIEVHSETRLLPYIYPIQRLFTLIQEGSIWIYLRCLAVIEHSRASAGA